MGSVDARFNLGRLLTTYFELPLIGGSYILEAVTLDHAAARDALERISRGEDGDDALEAIMKTAREEPFEERWPPLASINRQC